jgi:hypothetical protein
MTIPSVLVAIVEDHKERRRPICRQPKDSPTATFPSAEAYLCTAIVPTPLCIIADVNLPS